MYKELQPAYGRDYKSAKDVKADFDAGKDFQGDYSMNFALCNKADFSKGDKVLLRYKKNTQVTVHTVT